MGLFKSMWQAINRLLFPDVTEPEDAETIRPDGANETEDAETILTAAREEMERGLADLKERAVASINRRNALRNKLHARQKPGRDPELDSLNPKIANLIRALEVDAETATLIRALEDAEREVSALKQSIQAVGAQVRQRAAKRLARLPGWTTARIQQQLNKALSGISVNWDDQASERAGQRVRAAIRAEARSRASQTRDRANPSPNSTDPRIVWIALTVLIFLLALVIWLFWPDL